jgi:hypothetical protein
MDEGFDFWVHTLYTGMPFLWLNNVYVETTTLLLYSTVYTIP